MFTAPSAPQRAPLLRRPRRAAALLSNSLRGAAFGLCFALAAGRASADVGDLYVTSDALNLVGQYAGASGAHQSTFLLSQAADGQLGIHFGVENNRVLIGHFTGGVEEFNATTGAYIKTYNPGGGRQWTGLYGPNGNVLIGSDLTADVREYDADTGAFVRVLTAAIGSPADMRIGPNGNLYVCSFIGRYVREVNPCSGALVSQWSQPGNGVTTDIAFNRNGEILVSCGHSNLVHRYDSAHNLLGSFAGSGWGFAHGIEISPWSGNVLVVDGVTSQVHEFHPTTYAELNSSFLAPAPAAKIVDLAFRPKPCSQGGSGGAIPAVGTGDGVWPNTLPSAPLVGSLLVDVPGDAVLESLALKGLTHTWAGDLQVVLETPNGRFNVLHRPGAATLGCSDDLNGDYVIVDPLQGAACGPITTMGCGSGTIAPGTYLQSFGNWPSGPAAQNVDLEDIPLTTGIQTWQLYVYDWVSGDVGALTSWDVCFGARTCPSTPSGGPDYQCAAGTGPGGAYPIAGAPGVWPTVMPSGHFSSPLTVAVPSDATKIMAIKLYGWSHTWYDDTQIVLEAPASLGGTLYNVLQPHNGSSGGNCGDDVSGDYVFVDALLGLNECGNPASAPPACSGSIPPGVYRQSYGLWPSGASSILNIDLQSIAPLGDGVWTLHFYDWFPSADDGSLSGWEMCFDRGSPVTYCTGGTTSNNCVASISASANPSLSGATPCQITVANVEGARSGILFYGLAANSAPWASGSSSMLCVKSPTQRCGAQNSGGAANTCSGSFSLDWDAFQAAHALALGQPWALSEKVFVQAWFRDPPAPKTTHLSNALELTYRP